MTTQKLSCSCARFLVFTLLGSLAGLQALAASFTLNPTMDAFVTPGASGSLAHSNYGGAGALGISAPGLPQGEFQSILQFDLSGAKSFFDRVYGVGQWSLQSVNLQLTATTPNNAMFNANSAGQFAISLMQNNGWTEGTGNPSAPGSSGITFDTLSNFVSVADVSLGTFGFGGGNSGNSIFSLNLASDLSDDAVSGAFLNLRMYAADSAISYLTDSRSFGTAGFRPLLTLTVPEPGGFTLTLMGIGLLACRRFVRRNRQA
jgi:hypothetical protein